jgi:tRNA/tmRNA/rRNA uracil-C5-methylase (TrmA/RlmC/RlmD family)
MTEIFLEIIKQNLTGANGRLLDLYCGYGLFSYYLADNFKEIFGIDSAGESISSANKSLKFYKGNTKIKFIPSDINSRNLLKILPPPDQKEIIILDPPRQGTKEDVIRILSGRSPEIILHIFCGIENIPNEIGLYKRCGYRIKKILPFDMFSGTPNLEILIMLEKE